MAQKTIEHYTYGNSFQKSTSPHFSLQKVVLDIHCSALENQISEYFKIYFIEDGTGQYDVDFTSFQIDKSGIFCLSPGQVFDVKNEKVKSFYVLSFDKDFYCVETHGKEISCNGLLFNNVHRSTGMNIPEKDINIFSSIIENIINEFKDPGPAHKEMLETYLRMFMIQALRHLEEKEEQSIGDSYKKNQTVQDFITLVDKHFRSIHTVKEYAEMLFISPKSLTKKLKSLGYPTPTKIIKDRILIEAKRSLKFSNDQIKEIAYALGFNDPGYFTRLFSKEEGITPQAFRENS